MACDGDIRRRPTYFAERAGEIIAHLDCGHTRAVPASSLYAALDGPREFVCNDCSAAQRERIAAGRSRITFDNVMKKIAGVGK